MAITMMEFYKTAAKDNIIKYRLKNNAGLSFNMLESGLIYNAKYQELMINQFLGSVREKQVTNVYLRVFDANGIKYQSLIQDAPNVEVTIAERTVKYEGEFSSLEYECTLKLSENDLSWCYDIEVFNAGNDEVKYDLVYAQDVGIAHERSVRTNELYVSQYIDHHIFVDTDWGYVIGSRQNQSQDGINPILVTACLQGSIGYLTDGYQFYGLTYKDTDRIQALEHESLPCKRYQYEMAMPVVQSNKVNLMPQTSNQTTFVNYLELEHEGACLTYDLEPLKEKSASFTVAEDSNTETVAIIKSYSDMINNDIFAAMDLSEEEISAHFSSSRRQEEYSNGRLGAFFYDYCSHVVLKSKELETERSHGHIMLSGTNLEPADDILTVTSWMNGVFGSHIAVGNTNFNKVLTTQKNGLNVLKSAGQRIYIKRRNKWVLLGMPSAFEMGLNHARWLYKDDENLIEVKVWTLDFYAASTLSIEFIKGEETEIMITNNVMSGNFEYDSEVRLTLSKEKGQVLIEPDQDEFLCTEYPESAFYIIAPEPEKLSNIKVQQSGTKELIHPYVDFVTKPVRYMSLVMTGSITSRDKLNTYKQLSLTTVDTFQDARLNVELHYKSLSNYFSLEHETMGHEIERLNELIPWYLHNGMIHYLSPHGLEQYSGAAWGLRDVCQGPTEMLLTARRYDILKKLIKKVYSNQIYASGDWRQWFMFDKFGYIQDSESHNDIAIWPLKAICDYIEATNDYDILNEKVDYIENVDLRPIKTEQSIEEHIRRQLNKVMNDTIKGTALIRYGHGDWEDTLQPSNEDLRDNLVSSWTVSLVYETIIRYAKVCFQSERDDMARELLIYSERIRTDYNKYLVKDGIVSGLAYFGKGEIQHFLHPSDTMTGVQYRLIPMNRGIISELFTTEEASKHLELIENKLTFVDGVRLMDKPLKYQGGIETNFKRAETGANFGREIGMQYIHAHIRYLQALAIAGRPNQLFDGLQTINQVGIKSHVDKAKTRQSNCYFSSSDADFKDRYEAYNNFDALKQNEIGIKGGWRIYSSGPGIYLGRLVMDFLGIYAYYDSIKIDPVIPENLDGLKYRFKYDTYDMCVTYHIRENGFGPTRVVINNKEIKDYTRIVNRYRKGGITINKSAFHLYLGKGTNHIEIYM